MARGPLPDLWYESYEGRRTVPAWAASLVQIGADAVGTLNESAERLVAAVAVPTRAYAASLVAVGAVSANQPLSFGRDDPSPDVLDAHFRQLCSLRPGTTVTVGSGTGGSMRVGTFERVDMRDGEPVIVIRQRDFTQIIEKKGCHRIALRGRSLSCLLVGRINVFEEEIKSGDVVTRQSRPLQDILKVARFCGRRDSDVRSEVLSQGVDLPRELRDAQPTLVVFDGTAALRRWREEWRSSPWLIVLDRTSPQFDEGVALVEEEYVQRATERIKDEPDLDVPLGGELMAFWSSR